MTIHASDSNELPMNVDETATADGPQRASGPPLRVRPLTSRQERRLVTYLDERFLQCTRNFKKRAELSSTLRTLPDYLEEMRHLLALILQIPPVDPSTSLRIFYLLRLTGDVLSSIPGYRLTKPVSDPLEPVEPAERFEKSAQDSQRIRDTLRDILDFLDDLDQAWLAVLEGQVWDPETAEGVSLQVGLQRITESSSPDGKPDGPPVNMDLDHKTSPPSQTDVTRLRSLLMTGESGLEEWLLNEKVAQQGGQGDDLTAMLDRMGLLDEFDDIFTRTLDFLGGFGGDDVQLNERLGPEVPMGSCGAVPV